MKNTHTPAHLRDAFQAIVDEEWSHYDDLFDNDPMPYEALLWSLKDSSDVMPRDLCGDLGLRQGSTYSMGVGAYIALHGVPGEDD